MEISGPKKRTSGKIRRIVALLYFGQPLTSANFSCTYFLSLTFAFLNLHPAHFHILTNPLCTSLVLRFTNFVSTLPIPSFFFASPFSPFCRLINTFYIWISLLHLLHSLHLHSTRSLLPLCSPSTLCHLSA